MGAFLKIILLAGTLFTVFVGVKIHNCLHDVPPIPNLPNTWWGPGKPPAKEDTSIKEFKINVSDEVLKDLKQRLVSTRPFTPPLEGVNQEYGMNTKLLGQIVEFWKTKYDWREREKFLNQYPQYTTNIQGLKIHFLRIKPTVKPGTKVLPILILHGWPGSVREFYEIIPHLTSPQSDRDFVFEVIAPSLPGYGFSDGAAKPGLGPAQAAVVFKNLMERLGFQKYYIQGGDWGAIITRIMATLFPEKIIGLHSNMCGVLTPLANLKLIVGSFYPSLIVEPEYEKYVYPLSATFSKLILESGYMHLQATKPDTIGAALKDSPVGLAAYILEKFTTWTNPEWKNRPDGGLTNKFTLTQLLDNVMIYWITGSITTSVRLYSEAFTGSQMALQVDNIPVKVPTACAKFVYDLMYTPDSILKDHYINLIQSENYIGGHFAAFEEPKILANDIFTFVNKVESSFSKV